VTLRDFARRREQSAALPRVGLFGLLGSGNIGNDGMLEAMLRYLRSTQPDAVLDFMCTGPERISSRYGVDAIPLLWCQKYEQETTGVTASALKMVGKAVDAVRIASWVRRHDVVIVPGAGVLEAALPLRPWGVPYAMFLLCASGRLFGTKVALVSVGASATSKRATRLLFNWAARLAFFLSYRDDQSREAMRRRGLDVSRTPVYPDLAFALPVPPPDPGDPQLVGVGVMAYYGGNEDRRHADQINAAYVKNMKRFSRWLVDNGYRVRLFGGDNKFDDSVAEEILADVRAHQPGLDSAQIVTRPITSLAELMEEMAPVGTVVATRYHNVLCALKLCKPTISLGYSQKNNVLMADMGIGDFCQFAHSLDLDLLIKQFTEVGSQAEKLRQGMAKRNAEKARSLDDQFSALSGLLFPSRAVTHAAE
jgi:polysaccharide pyruvyl transferase WcaK-like protein